VLTCDEPPPPPPTACTFEDMRECELGIPSSCTFGDYACSCVLFAGVGTWVCHAPPPSECTPDHQNACELGMPAHCSYSGRNCHCILRDEGGAGTWTCDPLPPEVSACTMDDFNRCRAGDQPIECMYGSERCACTSGPMGVTGWVCQPPALPPPPHVCDLRDVRRCNAGLEISCVNEDGASCRCEGTTIVCG
jgi:hypothetical protein